MSLATWLGLWREWPCIQRTAAVTPLGQQVVSLWGSTSARCPGQPSAWPRSPPTPAGPCSGWPLVHGEGPASGLAPGSSPPSEACMAPGQAAPPDGRCWLPPPPSWGPDSLSWVAWGWGEGRRPVLGTWGKIHFPHAPRAPSSLPPPRGFGEILSPHVACPSALAPWLPGREEWPRQATPSFTLSRRLSLSPAPGRDSSDNPVNHTSKQRFFKGGPYREGAFSAWLKRI